VEAIGAIGKSPDKEVVYRCLGHRDIGDPGDKVFMHFGITKPETPTGRKVPPWGQLSANCQESQDSRNRESRGQVFFSI
jgi:hypothetical protein